MTEITTHAALTETLAEQNTLADGLSIALVQPKTVREAVVENLRTAIIEGRLKPGQRLVEREICEALGASRTSVREALRTLENERLVTVTTHRGPAVTRLTKAEAAEIFGLRAELEARLARAYCEQAPEGEDAMLMALHRAHKTGAEKRDLIGLVRMMVQLNEHMIAVSGLQVTGDLLRSLLARISRLRFLAMENPTRIHDSLDEIDAIIEALVTRDADAADAAMRHYVANAARDALERFNEEEGA
ncbi:GntR family transcriptional regulator [Maritimibacter alkaliphilus]|uniref:GntR family transcriptional regulator n=1 Tax=Maritimibacter alkaliphilus TaxID=404236 RepID=UPI001C95EB91|nr:GntR family transcriptional regulator [Maritimibacter alkaliphilus]MBY6091013.1 GntR family transcriptional regulator [Maritimibacter alkaliphilus]